MNIKGRPKVVRLKNGGTIQMKFVTQDIKEQIEKLVEGQNTKMAHKALGLHNEDGQWKLVVLSYNGTEARIDRVEYAGETKKEATDKFKVTVIKEGIF